MTHLPFAPPESGRSAFNCPFCHAYSNQLWYFGYKMPYGSNGVSKVEKFTYSQCTHCDNYCVWFNDTLIFPDSSLAPMPNPDLPEDIKLDYEEARSIIGRSPRGAAALLRLCIQKLCAFLGEPGTNINSDIAALVKKGLNPLIQKSLDVVRVVGNEAVHPGKIDLTDNPEIAMHLCKLVNIIADAMITQPKHVDALYGILPQDKRDHIEKRDSK